MIRDVIIRRALPSDILVLQAIELSAAQLYGSLPGYEFCQTLPPRSEAEHMRAQEIGIALVSIFDAKQIGFLLALPVDGRAHVLELAVGLDFQSKGVGRSLFQTFHAWAAASGFSEATLTTFRDPPWNGPLYARLGYRTITDGFERPALRDIQTEEAHSGFNQMPRVAMARQIDRQTFSI